MDKVVLGLWNKYDSNSTGVLTIDEARSFVNDVISQLRLAGKDKLM